MIDISKILKEKIKEFQEDNMIIVLRGFDYKEIFPKMKVDLGNLLENKLKYAFELQNTKRNIITYDEYLALYEIILLQYKKIIIIDNNLYMNYYPLNVDIEEKKIKSLLIHFDKEKEGEKHNLDDISQLVEIYGNIRSIEGHYYVAYNNQSTNEKELYIDLFEEKKSDIKTIKACYSKHCYEVLDENDYLNILVKVFNQKTSKIFIIEKNSGLNKNILLKKLSILRKIVNFEIELKFVEIENNNKKRIIKEEYYEILKEYWGHDEFRKLKIYNTKRLDKKEKVIEEIYQSNIIDDIVTETEKCITGKEYRDIFVTAPTGAGKSAMFQIPAIYLSNKHNLFTIVISPLIGLMKDQVNNLEQQNYKYARTINSDISPILKQEIINDIAEKKCNILYISPESLLGKSDLEQIIGNRILGLLVIDEAHIVTTWGKQFRPDYWFLGDHLNRIKKKQINDTNKGMAFVTATFTATAIYGGVENMYEETIHSLRMIDPITYLGYVRRDDININISKVEAINNRTEYELNKFDQLINKINLALIYEKKVLIYFPTVALINRFWDYCYINDLGNYISKYHGQLDPYQKDNSYHMFMSGEKPIILATKAFGMGIDIDDIDIVAHFAPTGNVCDYVQEIGRAARKPTIEGEAYYKFMKNDFKHINKLHGISVVKKYQLVQVIEKIYSLYKENLKNQDKIITKKRNEMLVDAENFSHIFNNPFFNEDDGINKVKTAMLLIQKDFESRFSFSPFYIRPIPLFEIGFFKVDSTTQKKINKKYGKILEEIDSSISICSLNLKRIWEKSYQKEYSFPKFKYLFYTNREELSFDFVITPAMKISVSCEKNYIQKYEDFISALRGIINSNIKTESYLSTVEIQYIFMEKFKIDKYRAKSIVETLMAAMSIYQREYCRNMHTKVMIIRTLKNGENKYKFMRGALSFTKWLDKNFELILERNDDGIIYLINAERRNIFKEKLLALGVLETIGLLSFNALGGRNSQIYIYINTTKAMKEIIEKPFRYKNKLLESISERHEVSVQMLTYLFESDFNNNEMWENIENYFLGIIPQKVINEYRKKTGKEIYIE